jgi:alkylmercury lyase
MSTSTPVAADVLRGARNLLRALTVPADRPVTPDAPDHGSSSALLLHAMRLMAHDGQPVSVQRLAQAAGRGVDEVTEVLRRTPRLEYDEDGRLVSAGLSLIPTRTGVEIRGRSLYTWCGPDTLLIAQLVGEPLTVTTSCPSTGEPITLDVAPDGVRSADPGTAVVTVVPLTDQAQCDIRSNFCDQANFYSSAEAATSWLAEHPEGFVLPVADAHAFFARPEIFPVDSAACC